MRGMCVVYKFKNYVRIHKLLVSYTCCNTCIINNKYARIIFFIYSQYISLIIFYIEIFIMFSVYICDSCRFSLLSFILAFLPLLFLSQSLVFVAIVFIVFIILLLFCQYSASYFIVFSVSFVSCS